MDHVRPDPAEPIAAARRQQANLLEPKTDQEIQLVNWLANQLDLPRLHFLVELVEYGQERGQSRPCLGERVPCRRAGRPASGQRMILVLTGCFSPTG